VSYYSLSSVLNPKINFAEVDSSGSSSGGFLKTLNGILSPYDMERLRAYTENLTDFNLVRFLLSFKNGLLLKMSVN